MRIAARAFESIINNTDAMLFRFHNFDLVLICREVPVDEVDNAIHKVRALFSEDPLTAAEDGSIEDRSATWYDLGDKDDFDAFLRTAGEHDARRSRTQAVSGGPGRRAANDRGAVKPRKLGADQEKTAQYPDCRH